MAYKVSSESPNIPKLPLVPDASVTFNKGALLYRDTSTGELKAWDADASNVTNIEAVTAEAKTTEASNPTIDVYPINGSDQLWIADCANNTAANQLNKAHEVTSATVTNTSSHIATSAGVFVALRSIGEASEKKLLGYFIKVGQVTA